MARIRHERLAALQLAQTTADDSFIPSDIDRVTWGKQVAITDGLLDGVAPACFEFSPDLSRANVYRLKALQPDGADWALVSVLDGIIRIIECRHFGYGFDHHLRDEKGHPQRRCHDCGLEGFSRAHLSALDRSDVPSISDYATVIEAFCPKCHDTREFEGAFCVACGWNSSPGKEGA